MRGRGSAPGLSYGPERGRNRKAKDFLFPRQQKLRQKDGKMDGLRRLCRISEEWLHAMRWNVSLKAYIHNFIFPVFLRITEPEIITVPFLPFSGLRGRAAAAELSEAKSS